MKKNQLSQIKLIIVILFIASLFGLTAFTLFIFTEQRIIASSQNINNITNDNSSESLMVAKHPLSSYEIKLENNSSKVIEPISIKFEKQEIEPINLIDNNILYATHSKKNLKNFDYLIKNLYVVDSSTKAVNNSFNINEMLDMQLQIEKNTKPQILIYHTHASETYCDSNGSISDTVVGVGDRLTKLLTNYGYKVIHDTTAYDKKDGKDNRNYAYSTARPSIENILEKYPSIEVVIDVHRDSGEKRVTTIDDKRTAQIMLFNGLCYDTNGPITSLPNDNLTGNLAFSLKLKLLGDELYPDFFKRIYLKNYRYNMHLKKRYILAEVGTEQNTVEEAKNAMEPFSKLINIILSEQ